MRSGRRESAECQLYREQHLAGMCGAHLCRWSRWTLWRAGLWAAPWWATGPGTGPPLQRSHSASCCCFWSRPVGASGRLHTASWIWSEETRDGDRTNFKSNQQRAAQVSCCSAAFLKLLLQENCCLYDWPLRGNRSAYEPLQQKPQ